MMINNDQCMQLSSCNIQYADPLFTPRQSEVCTLHRLCNIIHVHLITSSMMSKSEAQSMLNLYTIP